MPNPKKYRELTKILREHDPRFVIYTEGGKGSHRQIHHPDVDGAAKSYPVKCHGENTELSKGTLKAIIRRFNLPPNIFD